MFASMAYAEETVHYLKSGETLYSLSRQYNVSVKQIEQANSISDVSSLKAGSKLVIPVVSTEASSEVIGDSYTVKAGDTYFSIAKRKNMTLTDLFAQTGKNSTQALAIGEVINFKVTQPATVSVNENITTDPNTLKEERLKEDTTVVASPVAPADDMSIIDENRSVASLEKAPAPTSELAVMEGITWPVEGEISEHTGRQRGVQIAIASEQTIKSLSKGTVVYKGSYRELGQIVVVEHTDGYTYLYSGFDNAFVNIGDTIEAGTSLGKAGPTNKIIFSVFKDGNPINPKTAPRV